MTPLTPLDILSRWLHVSTACVVFGSAFFFCFLLPHATRKLEPEAATRVLLRARRAFKMVVHPGILLFLLTGAYNAARVWHVYNQNPGLPHGLFGLHLLLGLTIMAILLVQLAGPQPRPGSRVAMKLVITLLFLTVFAASCLKWAREWGHDHPRQRVSDARQLAEK